MPLPVVAVVGRPNVGKSTLVNRIARADDAIVHEERGVTRDRSYHKAEWCGRQFMLVDTGGIESNKDDVFQSSIKSQAMMAADEADAIIFITDSRTGITNDDQDVARVLQKAKAPVFLAVNKMDNPADDSPLWEFYSLGLGDPWALSATHGHGTGDLLDAVVAVLPEGTDDDDDLGIINVAIIGRPNAGKSSLANRLIGKDRSIVSDVAGTTRDAIDTVVRYEDVTYRLIDTAGIRKKTSIEGDVEYYGYVRALRAVGRADVCLLVIDASVGVTDQDQRIAGIAKDRGCAMAILLNKWDLLETDKERERIIDDVTDRLGFVSYAPYLRISALTGRSVVKIWGFVQSVYGNYTSTISTSKLNILLTELRDFGHTVVKGAKRLHINYGTQVASRPPTFAFFCNFPEMVDDNFTRYLENRMREAFGFEGTPIRLRFRKKA